LELGEEELAMEFSDEILNPALNVPPLYMRMQEKQDDITKVSMTSWNSHINNFRKTDFFIKHRNQIYKTFKEGLLLLQERYNKENVTLLDRFFKLKEESLPINLFGSASPLIKRTRQPLLIKEKRIKPTERLTLEITALLRLSENVIRLRNGVKQQIKVDEDVLPEGFKTELLERMALVENAVNKRFKTVQKPEPSQGAGHIPAPPDDTPEVTSFPETK